MNGERTAGITIGSENVSDGQTTATQRTHEWGCNGRMHECGWRGWIAGVQVWVTGDGWMGCLLDGGSCAALSFVVIAIVAGWPPWLRTGSDRTSVG